MQDLKIYENPTIEFNVIDYYSELTDLQLEEGEDFYWYLESDSGDEEYDKEFDEYLDYLLDESEEKVIQWAEEFNYFDDDEFLLEDNSINIEALRRKKISYASNYYLENPPICATPSGRAYAWFKDLSFDLPECIQVYKGGHMLNDFYDVKLKNYDCLIQLQELLESHGLYVNFVLGKESWALR
jgi:hypothetical protein